ncbi:PAS domain-containing protein [Maridesulfovibrio frigidus]|uniref:PAS domain-containing protein n=1 Tax=Maridesulfovibrio frigidus TaxID=340956 RepID=UPI0004E26639|nr:PAS domain-containing protein [Maridesulfovibrio frigidus]
MSSDNQVWDNLNTAVVISDPDFNVTYANKRAFDLFDELKIPGLAIGSNMHSCHKPETMVILKKLYQDFADKKIKLNHLTMDVPDGIITIVNVPSYNGDALESVVEMVFEGPLG